MNEQAAAQDFDVVVVGAGLAGAAAAVVLARHGYAVAVVDPYESFPPLFRAEKIEPDQVELLTRLGLFGGVEPATTLIREIAQGRGGRVVHRQRIRQFGISYCDIVNSVRAQYPSSVQRIVGRVDQVRPDPHRSEVEVSGGRRLGARMVLVSAGMGSRLAASLGASRRMLQEDLSLAFGFMLERVDGGAFDFDAVTYRPLGLQDRVGYLTLFRMGAWMRGNLFAYWPLREPMTREFIRNPTTELNRLLPGLESVIGPFRVGGKVEPFKIDLYRLENLAIPGVVFLGDAYQTVCPSTGTGLSKVLTDVEVLCSRHVPGWMSGGGIPAEKIQAFYADPQKVAMDSYSARHALLGRASVLDHSLAWSVRRWVRSVRFSTGW